MILFQAIICPKMPNNRKVLNKKKLIISGKQFQLCQDISCSWPSTAKTKIPQLSKCYDFEILMLVVIGCNDNIVSSNNFPQNAKLQANFEQKKVNFRWRAFQLCQEIFSFLANFQDQNSTTFQKPSFKFVSSNHFPQNAKFQENFEPKMLIFGGEQF